MRPLKKRNAAPKLWTQDVDWTLIVHSEDVQEVFWASWIRSTYYLYAGGITYFAIQIPNLNDGFSIITKVSNSCWFTLYKRRRCLQRSFCFPFVKIYFEILTRAQSMTLQISFFYQNFLLKKLPKKIFEKNYWSSDIKKMGIIFIDFRNINPIQVERAKKRVIMNSIFYYRLSKTNQDARYDID